MAVQDAIKNLNVAESGTQVRNSFHDSDSISVQDAIQSSSCCIEEAKISLQYMTAKQKKLSGGDGRSKPT